MKKSIKRLLSLALTMVMLFGMLPAQALADGWNGITNPLLPGASLLADGDHDVTEIKAGKSATLTADANNGWDQKWTSSNSDVTVTGNGFTATVASKTVGAEATITLTYTYWSSALNQGVTETETFPVKVVDPDYTEVNLTVGDSSVIGVDGRSNYGFKWTSEDSGVASLSDSQASAVTVTAVAPGSAVVAAEYDYWNNNGVHYVGADYYIVNVAGPSDYTVEVGGTVKINGQGKSNHSWTVSDAGIAKINGKPGSSATIEGVAEGEVIVTHTYKPSQTAIGGLFTKEQTETFKVKVVPAGQVVLKFDKNDGTGTIPAPITTAAGAIVTLPGASGLSKENYEFIGWTTVKGEDFNYVIDGKTKPNVYPAGDLYTIPEGKSEVTLYAAWVQVAGSHKGRIDIAIRADNTIPGEPAYHGGESYGYLHSGGVTWQSHDVDDVRVYIAKMETVAGTNEVSTHLTAAFWSLITNSTEYANMISKYGYGEDGQPNAEIVPYVIKYEPKTNDSWHIDCVIRLRDKVAIIYDANAPYGSWSGLLPDSVQQVKGSEFTVSDYGKKYRPSDSSIQALQRNGYTLMGWNDKSDGSGKWYTPGQKVVLNSNLTLYAIWAKNTLRITKTSDTNGADAIVGKPINYTITVTNPSSVALHDVEVVDTMPDGTARTFTVGEMAAGATVTLPADGETLAYTVTADDAKTGTVTNTAVVSAKDPTNFELTDTASVTDNVAKTFTVTYEVDGVQVGAVETYSVGDTVTVREKYTGAPEGYTVSDWDRTGTFEMPADNVVIHATTSINDYAYTVHYVDMKGNTISADESGKATFGTTISAADFHKTISGYVFKEDTGDITIKVSGNEITVKYLKEVTVTANDKSKSYGAADPAFDATVEGVAEGDEIVYTITRTDAGTDAGETLGEHKTIVPSGETEQGNYIVTYVDGTLTISEYAGEVTVTTVGGEFTYDGEAHGATVTVTGLPDIYTVETAASSATATHVSDGTVRATADQLVIKNPAGVDVTKKLNIKYVDGTIKITPAPLTVTTDTASKTYDGNALTAEGSVTGFVKNETATFTVTGSQTEVGSSSNTYTLVFDKTAKETDYTVSATIGTLTVTESTAEITVTTTGGTFPYDGAAHGATVEVTGLPTGYTLETATSNATATHVAEGTVTAKCDTLVIKNAAGVDVTKKLNIKYVDGSITITAVTLTVVTPSDSKVYDGTALTKEGSVTGFVNNETATFTTTGTQTAVGTSDNTYTLVFDKTAKETDYTVSATIGTLTVTESTAEITVTTTGGTFPYDGAAHGATVEVTGLPTGYTLETATSNATATHVAEGTVTAKCDTLVIRNAAGVDVTDKLNIKYVDGSITITAVTLTVVTPSDSKVYDGTALTKEGSVTGFVNNETATFTTTGTQTAVGSSDNTYTLVFDKTAKETDYTVSETVGTLTVSESTAEITVTTTGGEFEYDGQAHGATVEVSTLPEGYTLEKAASSSTATHVTEHPVSATCDTLVIRNAAGEDVTSNLKITYKNGSITITPATLTVKTPDANKVYDGKALTKAGTIEGLKNGETVNFTTTGTQTEVGSSDNSYELAWTGTALETDYTVSATVGTLTVTEFADEIVVTTTGGKFTYDGLAHGATVSVSTLPDGYKLETAASNATATDVTTEAVTAKCDTLVIRNAAGEDVTSKLKITYKDGTIEITPATLTVATPDAQKTYDGEALTAEGTISGFVNGETATFTTTGTQTEVGSSANTYEIAWDGTAKESNYTIAETLGTLKVNHYTGEITVTTTGGSKTYDGTELKGGVTVSELPKGYTLKEATTDVFVTHVADGEKTVTVDSLVIVDAKGNNVTANLKITKVEDATVKITAAPLTVTTGTASKTYDGTALTAEGSVTGFVNNETATFTVTGTQTEVGESDNTYTLVFDKNAHESDYTVSETVGTLTVNEFAGEITVTTTGGTKTYDGTALAGGVTVGTVPTGYTVTAETTTSVTHVADGEKKVEITTLKVTNAQNVDVTGMVKVNKVEEATVAITPATLTVITDTASKTYDGNALTAEGSIDGFVNNETATFTVTGTQTAVGTSDNTYTLVFDKTAAESDYTVSETVGKLTVTEFAGEITVTTTGGSKTYDGTELKGGVTVGTVPTGYTVTAETTTSVTHVADGEKKVEITTLKVTNAQNVDVTGMVKVNKVEDATVKITAAPLTVTTPSASREYDGTALTAEGSISGFVNNETATFTTTGTQTIVGKSDNTYNIAWDGTAVATDYTVSETVGELEVTESTAEITVTTTGGTKTYDGTELKGGVTVGELPTGYTLQDATTDVSVTHVGDGKKTVTVKTLVIVNAEGKDVTSKLNIKKNETATVEITPAPLTVKTETDTKVYDGEPLTAAGSITGFIGEETATFIVTGSRTEVGTGNNTYTLTFDKDAVATDYEVTDTVGTLTVTESTEEITVTTTGGEFTYDGKTHGATVEVSTLPKGYTLDTATSDATATHVTEHPVSATCDTLVIRNAAGVDVTSNLKITYKNGSITITPATLTVKTPDANKVYDGKALMAKGSITGFIGEETATFNTTGSQTAVGSSENTYTLEFNGTAAESDYTVSESVGTLTVTEFADEIVVTTTGGTFKYDGQAHGATVKVSTLPEGYTLDTAASSATATHVTEHPVSATCDTLVIRNAAGEDVTDQLNISYVNGTIQITPVELTVTTPSASKEYDGTALTAEGKISGFVNGEEATFVTTGSQTIVGDSKNTYTLNFNKTARDTDYTVSENIGTLKVTESTAEITVTTTGGTFVYDGETHKATVKVTGVPEGYTLITASSDDKAAHVADRVVTANCDKLIIENAEGEDVTSKLNIIYVNGTIEITPATLTVITDTASKVYDGEALTAEGKISGFIGDETATFTVTGSQTAVGTSNNTYTLNFDKDAVATDYTVDETVGKLTVTEYAGEITVTTTGGTFTYDGQEHKATVEVSTLPDGYTLVKAESNDKATHVAEGPVTADCDTLVIKNAADEDVTSKLNIKYVNDTIKITPATLTVVTPDATKVYDGDPLTMDGSISGFVNGEEATFATIGIQTEVGTSDNTYVLEFNKSAAESDYTVKETIGKLTVTEFADEIVVKTTGGKFEYDGMEHKAVVTVSELPAGYKLDRAESEDKATHVDAGIVKANCDVLIIRNAVGEDVTSKLNIKYVDDTIEITPVKLTVNTPDATKVYDGETLTAEGSVSGFVNNETATFVTTGSQTKVGESNNTYTLTFDKDAVATDYTVDETVGKLTVTEYDKEIVVKTTGGEKVYDGTALAGGVTVSELPKGYTLKQATTDVSVTHVAERAKTVTVASLVIVNADGEDVTDKLNITKDETATVEIKPAPVIVTTPDAKQVYNGKALTAEGKISGFITGESATLTTTGSQTDVGDSKNTYTITWDNAAESDYTVSETVGTLLVTPAQVTVTAIDNTKVYGTTDPELKATVSGLVNGESESLITYTVDRAKGENVGRYDITPAGETKQGNYLVNYVKATFTITPAKATVAAVDNTKVYGNADPELKATVSGLVNGDDESVLTYTVGRAKGENVGTYTITPAGKTEQGNYTVSYETAAFTITKRTVTVTANDKTWEYDGNYHTESGWTVDKAAEGTDTGLVAGDEIESVTVTGKIRNPGSTPNVPSDAKFADKKGGNYEVEYVAGTLTITNRTTKFRVDVTANSNTFKYDGNQHTVKGYTIEVKHTNAVAGAFANFAGKNPRTTGSDTFTIGGNYYRISGITASGSMTDAKKGQVLFTGEPVVTDEDGNDVTEQFSVNLIPGTIKVNPRTVVLQSANAAKRYNGEPLMNHHYTVGGDGFVKKDGVEVKFTGWRTEVGSAANTFTYTLTEGTKAGNYSIKTVNGTLTVTPVPVYTLTVHYVDQDGAAVAPDYVGSFAAGEQYMVYSPAVEGYTPEYAYVKSSAAGMPEENVELTVVYTKETPVTPPGGQIPEKGPDYDLTPVEDEEVPMAEGEHKDDIMHFLLMAAALILEAFYTDSRKKHQKKIFELKKQLGDTSMDEEK